MEMNWQQKALALSLLNGKQSFSICMRDACDWFVSNKGVERKEGGCLSSGCTSASHPEEAVHQYWEWATDPAYYLAVNAYRDNRRAVKWNGFMWEDVDEESV